MVARDSRGNANEPVNFKTEKVDGQERIIADEPHIGSTLTEDEDREPSVQTGFARGGTSRPAKGVSGKVEQLDNDGNVVKEHPGEIARIVREEGPQAGLKKLGGDLPPGEPEPEGKGKSKKGS